jgi:hypothetical protein
MSGTNTGNPCGGWVVPSSSYTISASDTSQIKKSKAVYVDKDGQEAPPLRFSSYAEKYAYMRGKASCSGSSFPCLS